MKKLLLLAAITLYSAAAFSDNTTVCPSSLTIRQNANFIKAEKLVHPNNVWQLQSAVFLYQDHFWDITFAVDLNSAATEASALMEGQAYFNQAVQLMENPIRIGDVCIYANEDYFVRATEHIFTPY